MNTVAVIGAGNGGKATAADLARQGLAVRLYEFPEYRRNIEPLTADRRLTVNGAISGTVELDLVTCDLAKAVSGADTVIVSTQALAHERAAQALRPHLTRDQVLILNPNSVGGALQFARVLRENGTDRMPTIAGFSTLAYGCRASGGRVDIIVKVACLTAGVFPSIRSADILPDICRHFPGVVPAKDVLDAGLTNANPIIHPPIAILNAARFENPGEVYFYRDGVSPKAARLIELLDSERINLRKALGYGAMTDPELCVKQGYAESTDYFTCYSKGSGFIKFTAPKTLDNRYFHEDIGFGLVLYTWLGERLGVPTPATRAIVAMGSLISGKDYLSQRDAIVRSLGIDGMTPQRLAAYLRTGA
ncbi:MAG: NAD/NADP octopine/nopaline dehydrogenase family protein [Kiritimatiellae bacterium]|nr:NAD/NADP octopine/nopaline dehydrogenase family protein [Kiritimatiellia bacterium]